MKTVSDNSALDERRQESSRGADLRNSGLRSEIVADRAADSVKLLIGLAAGFGACTPVDAIKNVLDGLGRADAHLVLEELAEKHSYAAKYVRGMHPELVRVLEDKCS